MSEIQEQDIEKNTEQAQQQKREKENTQKENAGTDLNLNTDIIHNRTTTYTSLSELYGVQLFTNQRIEEQEKYEDSMKLKEKNAVESIFVDKSATRDVDSQVTKELFQEPLVIAKQQEYNENQKLSNGIFVMGAIVITVIFMVILARYLRNGKKKKTTEETGNE